MVILFVTVNPGGSRSMLFVPTRHCLVTAKHGLFVVEQTAVAVLVTFCPQVLVARAVTVFVLPTQVTVKALL